MEFPELFADEGDPEPSAKRARVETENNQVVEKPGIVAPATGAGIVKTQDEHYVNDNRGFSSLDAASGQPGAKPGNLQGVAATKQERDETPSAPTNVKNEQAQVETSSGAYTQREDFLIKQENEGDLSFKYVENNGDPNNMIYLTGLKNIFSKQLPNMPKEYICRLVFDRRHRSVALVRKSGNVVGGITYRAFHQQEFGEIAFCAITSSEQVKGFGTRLMNHTKEYARTRDKLTHFLTYADNNAVGYFAKQGFTKEISLDKERWVGYIKDYDGGTLMECVMHRKISYTNFPQMIRIQRQALESKFRAISNSHVVHPGLDYFKEADAAHAAALAAGRAPPVRRPLPIESIPGVREAHWSPDAAAASRFKLVTKEGVVDATPDNLQRFMTRLLREVLAQDDSWPFKEAVSAEDVPDYYEVILDPVDLSLMEQRLKSGHWYLTLDIFLADFRRMFDNCRFYNSQDTVYFKLANKLDAYIKQYISSHVIFD